MEHTVRIGLSWYLDTLFMTVERTAASYTLRTPFTLKIPHTDSRALISKLINIQAFSNPAGMGIGKAASITDTHLIVDTSWRQKNNFPWQVYYHWAQSIYKPYRVVLQGTQHVPQILLWYTIFLLHSMPSQKNYRPKAILYLRRQDIHCKRNQIFWNDRRKGNAYPDIYVEGKCIHWEENELEKMLGWAGSEGIDPNNGAGF